MTVTINTQTPPITRAELDAVFNGNQKIIRAFEKLLNDVRATLPDAIITTDGDATAALAAAVAAQQTANTALANAATAQAAANAAQATANTALADAAALATVDYLVHVASSTAPNAHVLTAGTNVTFSVMPGALTLNVNGAAPTGSAGGDLSGTYPNPIVASFSGTPFGSAAGRTASSFLQTANNLSDVPTPATARTNLGLGTIATQNANAVAITGGTALFNSGSFSPDLSISNPNVAQLSMRGNGASTPSKVVRVFNGQLQVVNDAGSLTILVLDDTGNLTIAGTLVTGSNVLHATSVALANGAAAQTATLTNAPTAGNPTKWVPINDNGTTRYIPAW